MKTSRNSNLNSITLETDEGMSVTLRKLPFDRFFLSVVGQDGWSIAPRDLTAVGFLTYDEVEALRSACSEVLFGVG